MKLYPLPQTEKTCSKTGFTQNCCTFFVIISDHAENFDGKRNNNSDYSILGRKTEPRTARILSEKCKWEFCTKIQLHLLT